MVKKIKRRFKFLTEIFGYTYSHKKTPNIFHSCIFSKEKTRIAFDFDDRLETLGLNITSDSKLRIDVYFHNVTWGEGIQPDEMFAQKLKAIYGLRKNKSYFSTHEVDELIELYAEFITRNLKRLE
jgi:hypothetical protein